MLGSAVPWLADALVALGVGIMTVGVYGVIRMPDLYTRLHAASVAGFVGIVPFLVAAATTGAPAIVFRVILIGVFLLLTSTVATHAIAHAAYLRGERPGSPGGAAAPRESPAADQAPRLPGGADEGDVR